MHRNINSPIDSFGRTELDLAIARRNFPTVLKLLEDGEKARDEHLIAAIVSRLTAPDYPRLVLMEDLLRAGAKVDARSACGMTALHLAVQQGNVELIRMLITAGADINAENNMRQTPLRLAIIHDRTATADLLINSGAVVNDEFPLAVYRRNFDVMRSFLRRSPVINVNAELENCGNALHIECTKQNATIVESGEVLLSLLLNAGVDTYAIDRQGNTPLALALLVRNKLHEQLIREHRKKLPPLGSGLFDQQETKRREQALARENQVLEQLPPRNREGARPIV